MQPYDSFEDCVASNTGRVSDPYAYCETVYANIGTEGVTGANHYRGSSSDRARIVASTFSEERVRGVRGVRGRSVSTTGYESVRDPHSDPGGDPHSDPHSFIEYTVKLSRTVVVNNRDKREEKEIGISAGLAVSPLELRHIAVSEMEKQGLIPVGQGDEWLILGVSTSEIPMSESHTDPDVYRESIGKDGHVEVWVETASGSDTDSHVDITFSVSVRGTTVGQFSLSGDAASPYLDIDWIDTTAIEAHGLTNTSLMMSVRRLLRGYGQTNITSSRSTGARTTNSRSSQGDGLAVKLREPDAHMFANRKGTRADEIASSYMMDEWIEGSVNASNDMYETAETIGGKSLEDKIYRITTAAGMQPDNNTHVHMSKTLDNFRRALRELDPSPAARSRINRNIDKMAKAARWFENNSHRSKDYYTPQEDIDRGVDGVDGGHVQFAEIGGYQDLLDEWRKHAEMAHTAITASARANGVRGPLTPLTPVVDIGMIRAASTTAAVETATAVIQELANDTNLVDIPTLVNHFHAMRTYLNSMKQLSIHGRTERFSERTGNDRAGRPRLKIR